MMTVSCRRVLALVAFALAALEQRGTAQWQDAVLIPTSEDGYYIAQTNEPGQPAATGFVGRTDGSRLEAVGNTDATRGRSVVAIFKISNKIRTCPDGDGILEGEGEFSVIVDSRDQNTNSTQHFVMQAKAKYKGEVNDDAWLKDAVKAEIDVTRTLSGSSRGANGALLTPAGSNSTQHVSVPVLVGPGYSAPSFGPFSGGDPSHGRVSEAYDVAMGLAYWAGVYYSEAQYKWRDGLCAELSFDPPSGTTQPPPRAEVKVKVHVKSKRGEIVKAHFVEVDAHGGSSVSPPGGWSSDDTPLTFTYTAPPNQLARDSNAGFEVLATSRAGIAMIPEWRARLGTNWSGEITCERMSSSSIHDEQVTSSSSAATRYRVEVKDGAGRASGYSDQRSSSRMLRPDARRGYVFDSSDELNAAAQGERDAKVTVELNTVRGTYQIRIEHLPFDRGKYEAVHCHYQNGCREQSMDWSVQSCPPVAAGLSGTFVSPNEVSGSAGDTKNGINNHTDRWHLTWRLARQGTTR